MEFSEKDKLAFRNNLLSFDNELAEQLGINSSSIQQLNIEFNEKSSLEELINNKKNSYFLKEENTRIVFFYSFLKTIGTKRLFSADEIVLAKNIGLNLGLNAIGVAQLIHHFKTGNVHKLSTSKVLKNFQLYQN